MRKTLILGHFVPKRSKIAKLSIFFDPGLTSCEKAKKSLEWKYDNLCDGQTDGQTELDLKDPTRGSNKLLGSPNQQPGCQPTQR